MFAECGGDLHVKLIKRDNAVNFSRAREIHDGVDDLRGTHLLRHGVDFAENVARPVRVAMFVECEEFDTAPEARAFAHERLAFHVGREAEDQRLRLVCVGLHRSHLSCGQNPAEAPTHSWLRL